MIGSSLSSPSAAYVTFTLLCSASGTYTSILLLKQVYSSDRAITLRSLESLRKRQCILDTMCSNSHTSIIAVIPSFTIYFTGPPWQSIVQTFASSNSCWMFMYRNTTLPPLAPFHHPHISISLAMTPQLVAYSAEHFCTL